MKLSLAVQHHPSRADMLPALVEALGGDVEVVVDPEPEGRRNAWRCYQEALRRTPDDASHRVIVQDDAHPCKGFRAALEKAVAARPDNILCLFHAARPAENVQALKQAHDRGHAWAQLSSIRWIPTVAVCWPADFACAVYCWSLNNGYPGVLTADDEIIVKAVNDYDLHPVLASVPSLVDHDDQIVPVRGDPEGHRGGDDGRYAFYWQEDVTGVDWASGGV